MKCGRPWRNSIGPILIGERGLVQAPPAISINSLQNQSRSRFGTKTENNQKRLKTNGPHKLDWEVGHYRKLPR